MKNTVYEKNIKRMLLHIKLGILIGLFLTVIGILLKFETNPKIAINLFSQQSVVSDGSIILIGGIILMIGSLISFFKKKTIIEQRIKDLNQEKKEKRNQPNWLKYK